MKFIKSYFIANQRVLVSLGIVLTLVFAGIIANRTYAQSGSPAGGDRTLRIVSTNGVQGQQVTVSIELESQNDEVAASFSLDFDPTRLNSPTVAMGSGVPAGTAVNLNPNETANGRLGVLVDSPNTFSSSPPSRQVITVTFNIAADAALGATPITFVTAPTPLSVSNLPGALVPIIYEVGTVTISAAATQPVTISGVVTTPSGLTLRNASVTLTDANNVRTTVLTSPFGVFNFNNVQSGQTITVSVAQKRFRFASRTIAVSDNISDLNFVGLE